MRRTVTVPFGEWLPDLPEVGHVGATIARNVVPSEGAYKPLPSLIATTDTLDDGCRGAALFYDKDGEPVLMAGTTAKLYRITGAGVIDVSGGGYALPDGDFWSFERFNDLVIATNVADGPQQIDIETGTAFAALAGSPPRAKHVARVRDFLVLGDLDEGGAKRPRLRWSGFNDLTHWTTSLARQSDAQDLSEDFGFVQGIVGREFGTIFQERAITRMTYVGVPEVFQFDVVERERGVAAPKSIVPVGPYVFFLSEDGFYVWDGQQARSISDNKVTRWFFDRLEFSMRGAVMGASDRPNKSVVWAFTDTVDGLPNQLLIYSWKDDRWTMAEVDCECLFSSASFGYSLEDLDSFGDLDSLGFSLDSWVWQKGRPQLGVFDRLHRLALFGGLSLEAVLETAEFQVAPGRRVLVSELWPLVDNSAGSVTAQLGVRAQSVGDALAFGAVAAQNAAGFCPVRASGRFARARVTIPAGAAWTHAQGVEATYRVEGRR